MRATRIIVTTLIGVLFILGACASPAATTPPPVEPPPVTPPPVEPPPVTPPPVTPPPVTPPPVTPPPVTPPPAPNLEPGPNEVWVLSREYKPGSITVPVGTKVTWISKDGEAHTITSDPVLFDGTVLADGSFSYTFTGRGTFSYYCAFHADMAGTVIVE